MCVWVGGGGGGGGGEGGGRGEEVGGGGELEDKNRLKKMIFPACKKTGIPTRDRGMSTQD